MRVQFIVCTSNRDGVTISWPRTQTTSRRINVGRVHEVRVYGSSARCPDPEGGKTADDLSRDYRNVMYNIYQRINVFPVSRTVAGGGWRSIAAGDVSRYSVNCVFAGRAENHPIRSVRDTTIRASSVNILNYGFADAIVERFSDVPG